MNVLVLMAGPDAAFQDAGYAFPRNLVEIKGLPLVQHVLNSLESLKIPQNELIFCLRKDENRHYYTGDTIRLLAPQAKILEVEGQTAGAACTALLAITTIAGNSPLLIINGDQLIKQSLAAITDHFMNTPCDGGIVVFRAVSPRWSYVQCDAEGWVIETSEKRPISNLATAGFYFFRTGDDFVEAAMSMIRKDAHVDNQFYIAPVYNEMILRSKRIGIFEIEHTSFISLKDPRSVQNYEEEVSRKERDARR